MFNLISYQPEIDKIYLYAKNPYDAKYQLLINKRESTGLKHLNDPKAFIEYSNNMNIFKILKNTIQIQNAIFLRRNGGAKSLPLSKISHTYPTLMKLELVIPYLKKIQKTHKSCDTPIGFC